MAPYADMESIPVVGAAICDDLQRPTKFLAARRSYPASLAGKWEFPGGKVETAEDPLSALHREINEELGGLIIAADPITGPENGGWRTSDRHVMTVYRAIIAPGSSAEPGDSHDQLAWVDATNALELDWLPGDIPIVHTLLALLHQP